ncbi:MAG: leucine-rich repeat protein [Clostridium sp.]|nr:leucine-rich repeat protein [Clostridium sp.]
MIKRRKSIAVMLAIASVVSFIGLSLPQAAKASEYNLELEPKLWEYDTYNGVDKNGVTWRYSLNDDGKAFIKGTTSLSKVVEVPESIDGHTVEGLLELIYGDSAENCGEIEKVTLPSTLKHLGSQSLRCAYNLKDINFPSGIEYFGGLALPENWLNSHRDSNGFVIINNILIDGHKSSGKVTIPSNVTEIGSAAFAVCHEAGAFNDYDGITELEIPSNVKTIRDEAFASCKDLNKVTLAEGVEYIEDWAFDRNYSLKEVTIPKSIKKLSSNAFSSIQSIEIKSADDSSDNDESQGLVISSDGILLSGKDAEGDVKIPSDVKEIQKDAFVYNDKITSVEISENTKIIGESAFRGCENLKKVKLEEGVNSIGSLAFCATDISSLYLPDSIQAIGDRAFSTCTSLKEVSVGKNKPSGIEDVFQQCVKVNFRENYENESSDTDDSSIEYNSDNLVISSDGILTSGKDAEGDVEIPSNVKEIGQGAFKGNDKITSIKIPSSVHRISDEAFYQCSNLKDLKLSQGIIRIGNRAFSKIKISSLYLPDKLERLGTDAFEGCTELKDVSVSVTPPLGIDTVFSNCLKINYRGTSTNVSQSAVKPDTAVNDWTCIDGKWYYINQDGSKQTGWFFDIRYGKWYYLGTDGVRQIGWIYYAPYNSWFYLDPYDGARISGWLYDPNYGSWFFLNDNGTMKIGWMYDYNYNQWFYLNGNGTMRTGWFYDNNDGNWYYLYSNGMMAHSTYVDGYYVNASGAWIY